MHAANPTRQMALIREACFCGNLGKAEFPVANHFDRPSQSQMDDIAMRAHADGSGEGAGKMELAAIRHFRKRRDVERLFAETAAFEAHYDVRKSRFSSEPVVAWSRQAELITHAAVMVVSVGSFYAEDAADYARLCSAALIEY